MPRAKFNQRKNHIALERYICRSGVYGAQILGRIQWRENEANYGSKFMFAIATHNTIRSHCLDAVTSIELNWNWIQIFAFQMFSFGLSFVWLWLFDICCIWLLWWNNAWIVIRMSVLTIVRVVDHSSNHLARMLFSVVVYLCAHHVYLCAHSFRGRCTTFLFSCIFFYDDFYFPPFGCHHILIYTYIRDSLCFCCKS